MEYAYRSVAPGFVDCLTADSNPSQPNAPNLLEVVVILFRCMKLDCNGARLLLHELHVVLVPASAAAGAGASASIKELELIIKLLVLDIFATRSNLLFLQPKKQELPQQQADDDELQLQDSAEPCCSSHSSCSKGGTIPNLKKKKALQDQCQAARIAAKVVKIDREY
jgi:hypothetical protein